MRVCLDTNVLVAAFATRGLCADVFRAVLAEHDLVIGEVIIDELSRALERKLRLPVDRIVQVEAILRSFEVVPRPAKPSGVALRDASDRWILATALAGRADVLVTGDRELLELGDGPLPVLDPRAFWRLLRSRRNA